MARDFARGATGVAVAGERVAQPLGRDVELAVEARAQPFDERAHRIVRGPRAPPAPR